MNAAASAKRSLNISEWKRLGYDANLLNLRSNKLTQDISLVFQYVDERNNIRWTRVKEYHIIEPVRPVCFVFLYLAFIILLEFKSF